MTTTSLRQKFQINDHVIKKIPKDLSFPGKTRKGQIIGVSQKKNRIGRSSYYYEVRWDEPNDMARKTSTHAQHILVLAP